MENPYWHDHSKPHIVDYDDVRELCFEAFAILQASRSLMGRPADEIGGALHDVFFREAEPRLSNAFLQLAVLIRTFEDSIAETEVASKYKALLDKILEPEQLGTIGYGVSVDRKDVTVRDVCNKIIHAEDFRPTYDNGSNPRDEDFSWGMTGIIEISGRAYGKPWDIWLNAEEFLEACLTIADYFDGPL